MRFLTCSLTLVLQLWLGQSVLAQPFEIYQDDFEGEVAGWTDNRSDYKAKETHFLGRFGGGNKSTSRIFFVPKDTEKVVVAFDFYRFGSWDDTPRFGNDRLEIDIDQAAIFSLPFIKSEPARFGTIGAVKWRVVPVGLGYTAKSNDFEQTYRIEMTVNDPGSELELTLRAALNQGSGDESAGFDNISVMAYPLPVPLTDIRNIETSGLGYSQHGGSAEYTLSVQNAVSSNDDGVLVFIDNLPADIALFTGDLDGGGNPVLFEDSSATASGLTCCDAQAIEFSNSKTTPPVFGYEPVSDYDSAVTHIRITPSGTVDMAQRGPIDLDFTFLAIVK